jgi:O-antigen/teichoic acid export membrane protein
MSPPSGQLFRNATLTVVQVVLSATFLFFIYRFLLGTIGAEQMGVWSIVMALSTVARITDLGFAGGMTRFVAMYQAQDDHQAVLEVVETGTLSLAVLSLLMLALAYPVLYLALPRLLDAEPARLALQLLPFSLVSFGLLAVGGAFLSSLDGMQRADLRNQILIAGTVLHGLLIPLCVWRWGFVGLGWAQCGQTVAVLLLAWWQVRQRLGLGWLPRRWRLSRFREMLGYNVHLQVTTLASFLGDPLTKLMMGHFGGLAMVAYFEMAGKLISQFRAIVVNVNQVLVPSIAHAQEKDRDELLRIFQTSFAALLLVSLLFYSVLVSALPLASTIWIGAYNPTFVHCAVLLVVSMQLNTLVGPAYFANMGTGRVSENAASQLIIGLVNLLLGLALGAWFGGWGVAWSFSVGVVAGSAFLMLRHLRHEGYAPSVLRPRFAGRLLTVAGVSLASHLLIDNFGRASVLLQAGGAALTSLVIVGLLWRPLAADPVIQAVTRRLRST